MPSIKIINRIKIFAKNIGYLFKYDIKKISNESVTKRELNLILDGIKFEIDCDLKNIKKPKIMSPMQTIIQLIEKKASFCRFGDGEFCLIYGEEIAFQKFDNKLSQRLIEILQSNLDNVFVGLNHSYFSSLDGMRQFPKNFIRSWVAENRKKNIRLKYPWAAIL